jgi:hypothetical protein
MSHAASRRKPDGARRGAGGTNAAKEKFRAQMPCMRTRDMKPMAKEADT